MDLSTMTTFTAFTHLANPAPSSKTSDIWLVVSERLSAVLLREILPPAKSGCLWQNCRHTETKPLMEVHGFCCL